MILWKDLKLINIIEQLEIDEKNKKKHKKGYGTLLDGAFRETMSFARFGRRNKSNSQHPDNKYRSKLNF